MPEDLTAIQQAAVVFDVLQTALGSRSKFIIWRLARLPTSAIVKTVIEATVPDPESVDELFRHRSDHDEDGEGPEDEEDGTWLDPVVA